jgi:hypothetical protein
MLGHIFGNNYHTPPVQLFDGDLSTIEASLQHSVLDSAAFVQWESAEWPTSQGGPLTCNSKCFAVLFSAIFEVQYNFS